MHVFLAGATGVLGRRIVPLLMAQGHRVTGLVRTTANATALRARGAEAAVANVYDVDALTRVMRTAAPDVVMHQLTDLGALDLESNAEIRRSGTRNLVDAALAADVAGIVAQSVSWAYEGGDEPAAESTPLDLDAGPPRSTTVSGVAALERIVREMPHWVVLRYGVLYGPTTWYHPGALMADRAVAGELTADADVSSFVHVDDAANAAVAALAWSSGAVNICDNEPASGFEWLPVFCESVGAPRPRTATGTARRAWARGADNRHAREDLGWTPSYPSWRSGFTAG
ncbi:MAG: NAD(P)-dependent oxidoreductase [Kutzneria sp.]|nr:NAD(P)-dependent oxidoreductase [Kutzneria sp.]MBV9845867.1 NAD(P)-dependent oxidoreductase [Kutzneria sp.]